jgi:3-deoxy-7-phosphoheptulonate synthase
MNTITATGAAGTIADRDTAAETIGGHAPAAAAGAPAPTAPRRGTVHRTLPAPDELLSRLPATGRQLRSIARAREEVRAVLDGVDDRLLVIVGPCSIHDPEAGLDYARRLAAEASRHRTDLLVVMRTYFEKPRTTVGWKGLINDPHLDGSHDVADGLETTRRFLLDIAELELPAGTEFLEPISPHYLSDLVSWGAIGARTTESQVHRQLVSGLPLPVGFKNGTDGGLQVALDACAAAAAPQSYLGVDGSGRIALCESAGNPDTHVILRGGSAGPNYGPSHIADAVDRLSAADLNPRLIIDASHANSGKSHLRQAEVAAEIAGALDRTGGPVAGVMLESFLVGGAQKLDATAPSKAAGLTYGQSVTDACMGWEATAAVLEQLAAGTRKRRETGR